MLTKTCDATALSPDKFDIATITRVGDKVVYEEFSEAKAQALLDAAKEEAVSADA